MNGIIHGAACTALLFLVLECHVITSLLSNEYNEWNKKVAFRDECRRMLPSKNDFRKLTGIQITFACAFIISSQQTAVPNSLVSHFSDLYGSGGDDIGG